MYEYTYEISAEKVNNKFSLSLVIAILVNKIRYVSIFIKSFVKWLVVVIR